MGIQVNVQIEFAVGPLRQCQRGLDRVTLTRLDGARQPA